MNTISLRSRLQAGAAALLVLLLLAGCALTVTDGRTTVRSSLTGRINISLPLNPVITRFAPTRGEGASYRIGESIQFNIATNTSGYVTLTYLDSSGAVNVFARNIFISGDVNNLVSGPDSGHGFEVGFPPGTMLIRAAFTPQPTVSSVAYVGIHSRAGWLNQIQLDVRGSSYADVVQTWINVN